MPAPRYDVARAFINGKEASNSTGSFRSVKFGNEPIFGIYTYDVCLAVRFADGTIKLPTEDGRYHPDAYAMQDVPNIDKRYSVTSSMHQNALRVVLEHPNFGNWKDNN